MAFPYLDEAVREYANSTGNITNAATQLTVI